MTAIRRLLIFVFGLALSASTAGAYYHFYHYTNRTAPYNPVPEKFDLNALPNKTVTFFLTDSSAAQFSPSSQFPSALAAIREGARVWNAVESSDLRVVFGGLASSNTPQNTPGADIVFDDLDPFTLGLTSTFSDRLTTRRSARRHTVRATCNKAPPFPPPARMNWRCNTSAYWPGSEMPRTFLKSDTA